MAPAPSERLPAPLFFVLPENRSAITGGNIYNRCLLEALDARAAIDAVGLAEARALLEQGVPGIFVVDSLLMDELPGLTARAGSGQRIFMLAHYLPSLEPRRASSAAAARDRALLRGAAGFIVTSQFMRDRLMARYSEGRPVLVVPPALLLFPSERELACRTLDDGRFRGLMVANLSPVKGVLELLRSLAPLLTERDVFTLDIAGRLDLDPDYARACQRLVERSPLRLNQAVQFRGPLGPDALRLAYLSSTIFISASEMESYGMAVREALAFGVPVLALEAGNVREHVFSSNRGKLFGSIPDLAKGCIELIRNQDALAGLGRTALEHRPVASYSWGNAAQLLVAQLSQCAMHK